MISRWGSRAGIATILLAASAVTVPDTFSGDIRYEIGAKAVSGFGAADTFTHRPLLYRLVSAMITAPAERWSTSVPGLEIILRLECAALVLIAAGVLWLGLRHRLPRDATPIAVATAVALLLVGPRITLEPDWLAVVLTVLGIGAALALPHRVVAGTIGGTLLAAAAATKIVTLPVALIGLLVIMMLDRRRAIMALAAAAAAGTLYCVAVVIFAPHEIGWLLDLGSVQDTGRGAAGTIAATAGFLGNAATLWPAVALLPAALVGAPRRWVIATGLGVALAWLPAQIQGQFYPYHLTALPVLAAVVLVLALRRSGLGSALAVLAYSGWAGAVIASPPTWRAQHLAVIFAVTGLAAVGAFVARLLVLRRARTPPVSPPVRRTGPVAAALVVAVSCLAASTPSAYASISLVGTKGYNPVQQRRVTLAAERNADLIRAHIGARSTVTYLTFGDVAYFLGNPTRCRYPSPVFLQRGGPREGAAPTRSWDEALQCLTATPGDWLIWDTTWFKLRRQPPAVVEAIQQTYDCEHAFAVGTLRVCRKRSAD